MMSTSDSVKSAAAHAAASHFMAHATDSGTDDSTGSSSSESDSPELGVLILDGLFSVAVMCFGLFLAFDGRRYGIKVAKGVMFSTGFAIIAIPTLILLFIVDKFGVFIEHYWELTLPWYTVHLILLIAFPLAICTGFMIITWQERAIGIMGATLLVILWFNIWNFLFEIGFLTLFTSDEDLLDKIMLYGIPISAVIGYFYKGLNSEIEFAFITVIGGFLSASGFNGLMYVINGSTNSDNDGVGLYSPRFNLKSMIWDTDGEPTNNFYIMQAVFVGVMVGGVVKQYEEYKEAREKNRYALE